MNITVKHDIFSENRGLADANSFKVWTIQVLLPQPRNNLTPHIHIDRDDKTAKFWINPAALASSAGFSPRELRTIQLLVIEHRTILLEGWNGYFGA